MNTRTAVIGVGLVIVAVVLFVVLGGDSGSDSSSSDASTSADADKVPTVVVNKQGEPVGGIADLTYKKGDQIHFNGYDVMKEVPKGGGTVTYDLPAELEGVFEAELEGRGEQIVELKVEP
jgi:hypothetical protein